MLFKGRRLSNKNCFLEDQIKNYEYVYENYHFIFLLPSPHLVLHKNQMIHVGKTN